MGSRQMAHCALLSSSTTFCGDRPFIGTPPCGASGAGAARASVRGTGGKLTGATATRCEGPGSELRDDLVLPFSGEATAVKSITAAVRGLLDDGPADADAPGRPVSSTARLLFLTGCRSSSDKSTNWTESDRASTDPIALRVGLCVVTSSSLRRTWTSDQKTRDLVHGGREKAELTSDNRLQFKALTQRQKACDMETNVSVLVWAWCGVDMQLASVSSVRLSRCTVV